MSGWSYKLGPGSALPYGGKKPPKEHNPPLPARTPTNRNWPLRLHCQTLVRMPAVARTDIATSSMTTGPPAWIRSKAGSSVPGRGARVA